MKRNGSAFYMLGSFFSALQHHLVIYTFYLFLLFGIYTKEFDSLCNLSCGAKLSNMKAKLPLLFSFIFLIFLFYTINLFYVLFLVTYKSALRIFFLFLILVLKSPNDSCSCSLWDLLVKFFFSLSF